MINKVTLIGHIGQAPELRTLESGTSVARFTMATNENYKKKGSDDWVEETEWHVIIAWRHHAEKVAKYPKGTLVYVEGKITHRKYEDKEGITRMATEVVAATIRKMTKSESQGRFPSAADEPASTKKTEVTAPKQGDLPIENKTGDDLPF